MVSCWNVLRKDDVLMKTDLEPFDTRLADRIRALETQREGLTERVADLRRDVPATAASNFESIYLGESERLEKEAQEAREKALQDVAGANIDLSAVDALGRWDDVKSSWEKGTEGLVGLKGGLGETRAKIERASAVVEYVEGRG